MREGYKVVALLLGLFGLVGRRRVLLPHPGSATGHLIAPGDHHTLQHIHVHFGVDFKLTLKMWPSLETTPNTITVGVRRVVQYVEQCPQALNRPDLHFEGAGNGPVVISWIGREHGLYSGTSPISLVVHCVTFRHDRTLLSLVGFVHNWPASRWSAAKKKKKTGFH